MPLVQLVGIESMLGTSEKEGYASNWDYPSGVLAFQLHLLSPSRLVQYLSCSAALEDTSNAVHLADS